MRAIAVFAGMLASACQSLDEQAAPEAQGRLPALATASLSEQDPRPAEGEEGSAAGPASAGQDPLLARIMARQASAPGGGGAPAADQTMPNADTLAGVVRRAIDDNPRIRLAEAKADEAFAGIGVARSALYPQLEGSVGTGQGTLGNYQDDGTYYFNTKKAQGAWRSDLGLTGRQLIYDFGATDKDIERARSSLDSEQLKTLSTGEEIAFNAASAYLSVLEKRELLAIAKENVVALQDIARLVGENQKAGNATLADVKRVNARLVDAQGAEGDQTYELQIATDTFRRLARAEPGKLRPAPDLARTLPRDEVEALKVVQAQNPTILAFQAAIKSRQAEIDSVKSNGLPRLSLDGDVAAKHYQQHVDQSELDARAVLTLRYTFLDGGKRSAQIDQAAARLAQETAALRDERETLEADVRKFYWVRNNARGKADSLRAGVADSEKAKELYREQFSGGKRSLLELLDVQTSAYTARRNQIMNTYEERRATYGILRAMGRFVPTALAGAR